jgi:hypothetical protein
MGYCDKPCNHRTIRRCFLRHQVLAIDHIACIGYLALYFSPLWRFCFCRGRSSTTEDIHSTSGFPSHRKRRVRNQQTKYSLVNHHCVLSLANPIFLHQSRKLHTNGASLPSTIPNPSYNPSPIYLSTASKAMSKRNNPFYSIQ